MTIKIGNKDIFGSFKVTIDDVTFEEFLEFAEEDITCELLNGVLVINSPASYKHQAISRFLLTYFDLVGLESGTGRSLSAPFIIKLAGDWAPEPDVFFFLNDKKDRVKKAYFEGIPGHHRRNPITQDTRRRFKHQGPQIPSTRGARDLDHRPGCSRTRDPSVREKETSIQRSR
jgi:hypothetical protein